MSGLKTISTAEPSIVHLVEKAPDPDNPGKFLPHQPADVTLCGVPWDRISGHSGGGEGATCRACIAEARRRGGA